eukprot:m.73008 g.73008  ORF g.73008 m.73008 type:complete len:536 (+) comp14302_c0_seq1:315-1922(+)
MKQDKDLVDGGLEDAPLLGADGKSAGFADGPRLPFGRKIAFAIGAVPPALTNAAIGFYFTPFLLETADIRPIVASMILLLSRFWDAITDPVIGYLTAKTHTRYGQLRPWIFFSAIPCGIVYFFMWFVPESASYTERVFYFVFMYLLYQTLFSCHHVPYTSLTVHLSHHPKDRDSATMYRMVVEILSVLIGSAGQGIIVDTLGGNHDDDTCRDCDNPDPTDASSKEKRAFMVAAAVFAIVAVVCAMVVSIFVPEQKRTASDRTKLRKESFLRGFRIAVRCRPYIIVVLMLVFVWTSVAVFQNSFVLYFKYSLKRSDKASGVLLTLLGTTVLSLPLWLYLLTRYGKRRTFIVGILLWQPAFIAAYVLPEEPPIWALHVWGVWAGSVLAAAYLTPWAMLPDVIDFSELHTGVRREALFYSFFVFFQKFATGIALGVSTGVMQAAGYITDPCCDESQPSSVEATLRFLAGPAPIIVSLISVLCCYFYPLTKERCAEMRVELRKLRHKKKQDAENETLALKAADAKPVPQPGKSVVESEA